MSESDEREPMGAFLAVFNGHVNDADKRARDVMRAECPDWLAEVERIERDGPPGRAWCKGIMAIFDVYDPPASVKRYASLVQDFVNGATP